MRLLLNILRYLEGIAIQELKMDDAIKGQIKNTKE